MQERISELLDKASQLHRESPRALPSLGLARATATEAVECTRLELELLWTWRRLRPSRTTVGATVRVAVYRILRRLGGRLFRWSQRHDLTAIDQLKRFVDRKLLGA